MGSVASSNSGGANNAAPCTAAKTSSSSVQARTGVRLKVSREAPRGKERSDSTWLINARVPKQQDTSRRAPRSRGESRTDLWLSDPLSDNFDAAAAQCVQDADPDAVHQVRTGSRRLQATLEAMLREARRPRYPELEQPARGCCDILKQIRRTAGPVRDLDVHRKLLEKWIGKRASKRDDGHEPSSLPRAAMQMHSARRRPSSTPGSKASVRGWRMPCRGRSGSGCRDCRNGVRRFRLRWPYTPAQPEDAAPGRCRGSGGLCACGRRNAAVGCREPA